MDTPTRKRKHVYLIKRLFLYILFNGVVQYKHTLTYLTHNLNIYRYKTVEKS